MGFTRRHFLTTAAGASLALPLMPSLMPRRAAARGAPGAPKRFIAIFTSNGQRSGNFWPDVPDSAWTDLGPNIREVALSDLPDPMSTVFGPEFAPVKDKLTLLRGLDNTHGSWEDGHQYQHWLSGWWNGSGKASLDQIIASSSAVYPDEPAWRSSHIIVKPKNQTNGPSVAVTMGGTPIEPATRPQTVYQQLFGGFMPPDPEAPPDPKKLRRAELMDTLNQQYVALRDNPRIGAEDRIRLDEHMDLLFDLRARLTAQDLVSCMLPGIDDAGDEPSGEMHLPDYTDMQVDLVEAAIKCDRTRVIVLQLCQGTDIRTFEYLPGGPIGDHHALSHQRFGEEGIAAAQKLGTMNRWYGDQVARLLQKLDTIEDPATGTTYLDNSLVYWGNEDGCSQGSGDSHLQWGYPVMLAGAAGGAIRPGRLIDYRRMGARRYSAPGSAYPDVPWGEYPGRPYNQLLVSIATAMGLTPEEYEVHGVEGIGDPTNDVPENEYDTSNLRATLPHLMT